MVLLQNLGADGSELFRHRQAKGVVEMKRLHWTVVVVITVVVLVAETGFADLIVARATKK